jgi:ribosomal protein S18 acetylase RimI-like enzyme
MSKASFRLRDYGIEDIPKILRIIKTAFAEQQGKVDPPSSAESKTIEIVEDELKTANALVIEVDLNVIACVFYHVKTNEIYIDRLAVLPEFRKQGLGNILMEEIERRSINLAIETLSLSVRIELNQQQDYYRKMGFEISSYEAHDGYKIPTYVVMKKSLKCFS